MCNWLSCYLMTAISHWLNLRQKPTNITWSVPDLMTNRGSWCYPICILIKLMEMLCTQASICMTIILNSLCMISILLTLQTHINTNVCVTLWQKLLIKHNLSSKLIMNQHFTISPEWTMPIKEQSKMSAPNQHITCHACDGPFLL